MKRHLCLILIALLGVASCEKEEEQREPPAEAQTTDTEPSAGTAENEEAAAKEKTSEAEVEPTPGWNRVDPPALDEQQSSKLESARTAQKRLGSTLLGELTAAVSEKDFQHGIEVCSKRAGEIRREVRRDMGLKIGRTSHRLRNPDNVPPEWAEPFVEAKVAGPTVLVHDDGRMGYMAPIKLGDVCVSCHGPKEKLGPGVEQTLTKLYPEDEATGFEPGDLRGWFWVEVPAS